MVQLKVIVNKLNKRRAPISDFSDKGNISGVVYKGYLLTSIDEESNALGTWYKDKGGYYYWGGGLSVLSMDHPLEKQLQPIVATPGKAVIPLPHTIPKELPLTRSQCLATAQWLELHYGEQSANAVEGTPFTNELLYAIACQETAIYFYEWTKDHSPDEVLGRCVFDASGDVNGTRKAFPKNTAEFIEHYGKELADMLIAEANATRVWRGYGPKQWVYAGYGLFQYDLQHILTDETFFREKQWYQMEHCLEKVMSELKSKWALHTNDLFGTVKAYNGSGPKAENYANNVLQFLSWIRKG
ncbi:MAG: hypothetical protein JST63_07695 [Bacteroidetes bacterium]|nr:hypothetical protein [Bacteroidota bacterium]